MAAEPPVALASLLPSPTAALSAAIALRIAAEGLSAGSLSEAFDSASSSLLAPLPSPDVGSSADFCAGSEAEAQQWVVELESQHKLLRRYCKHSAAFDFSALIVASSTALHAPTVHVEKPQTGWARAPTRPPAGLGPASAVGWPNP